MFLHLHVKAEPPPGPTEVPMGHGMASVLFSLCRNSSCRGQCNPSRAPTQAEGCREGWHKPASLSPRSNREDSGEIQATMNRNGLGKGTAAQQQLCTARSTACPKMRAPPLLLSSWDTVARLFFCTKCWAALQGGGTSPIISFPPEDTASQETFISAPLHTGWLPAAPDTQKRHKGNNLQEVRVWGGPREAKPGSGDQPGWQKYPKVLFAGSYSPALTGRAWHLEIRCGTVMGNHGAESEPRGGAQPWGAMVEPLKLEKASKTIKPNHQPTPTMCTHRTIRLQNP